MTLLELEGVGEQVEADSVDGLGDRRDHVDRVRISLLPKALDSFHREIASRRHYLVSAGGLAVAELFLEAPDRGGDDLDEL